MNNPIMKLHTNLTGKLYSFVTQGTPEIKYNIDDLRSKGYTSQSGQDKFVAEVLLPGLQSGVFVDIGAHDGVSYSNTFYLEKQLGWTGLAVEPIPSVYDKLMGNRTCITVNGCITDTEGLGEFIELTGYTQMLSGLKNTYDKRHLERIRQELKYHNELAKTISVQCYTLKYLLQLHNIPTVHYLSIDIEGGELGVLKSINFRETDIHVIGVENSYNEPKLIYFMKRSGFKHVAKIGADEFFVSVD